ncbi:MAG: hypothetical protein RBR78_06020 [Flavobacteriaceae bacterium]|jgi:hypothetical protein|nr:hypothetical protein [Flavobacteriaceae bacterium]
MDTSEKEKIYDKINKQHLKKHIDKYEKKVESVLDELSKQSGRALVILGCAYLEELCKSCFFETMTNEGRKKYLDNHNKELTFSLTSTFLYAQDYISKEIFDLLKYIREIRNKYAHIPIFEKNHIESIKAKNSNIRKLLDGRWISRDVEKIKKLEDVDDQLYFIVFENLIYGLMALEMYIIPNQKLAKLQFVQNQKMLNVSINMGEFNEYTEHFISIKLSQ